MTWLLFVGLLFAHEDVPSTICKSGDHQIVITKNATDYSIVLPGNKMAITFEKPSTEDVFDKKTNQLFDTYQFTNGKTQFQVKRPETKGPIKTLRAFYNNEVYTCS